MKKKYLCFIAICVYGLFSLGGAQQIINLGIGPTWPDSLRKSDKPTAWNASIEYGRVFDNIIGFGVDIDFTWNVFSKDTTGDNSIITKTIDNKFFMFPLSVYLFIDPLSKYPLHPVARAQLGVNMAAYSYDSLNITGKIIESDRNGFYIGIIGKAGLDAVYDLGEHAAIFAGFEYQWGKLRRKIRGTGKDFYYFGFRSPCIRMGLSFLF